MSESKGPNMGLGPFDVHVRDGESYADVKDVRLYTSGVLGLWVVNRTSDPPDVLLSPGYWLSCYGDPYPDEG